MHFESSICKSQEHISGETRSHSIAQADSIYEYQSAVKQYNYVLLHELNKSENPESLWRYGRACYCLYYAHSSASKEEKATTIMDGLKAIEKAILLDPQNAHAFVVSFMHITTVHCNLIIIIQWLGRLTGYNAELSAYMSPLQSCRATIKCREHFKVKLALFM